jgi:ABC-2 type transport system permease protein
MPDRNLLRRLARRNAAFLAGCTILFGGFEFLIAGVVGTLDLKSMFAQIFASLPPVMQGMLGPQLLGGLTPQGVLAFGWNHPIVLALGGALAIVLAARAIAGEVESGAIELVLAQPISRASYLSSQISFGLGALALLSLGGLAGSLAGQAFWGVPLFHPRPALALTANFWLLQAAAYGVALLISALAREAGRVGSLTFILLLASFLLEVIGGLWRRAHFLLPWSIYERFQPRALLQTGAIPGRTLLVLGGIALLGTALACWHFSHRDLP